MLVHITVVVPEIGHRHTICNEPGDQWTSLVGCWSTTTLNNPAPALYSKVGIESLLASDGWLSEVPK